MATGGPARCVSFLRRVIGADDEEKLVMSLRAVRSRWCTTATLPDLAGAA